jgi:benzoyl-CoA-dihydrodiol lyase
VATETKPAPPVSFETEPSKYRHWKLVTDGPVARLTLAVREHEPLRPGYELKLNSYDLGVDLELQDAIQRLRFEHPEVRCVVVTGGIDRVFSAGANIHMLGSSSHAFKVNFCKFTNETRLSLEDASRNSGQRYLAALNGTCAGGGYELALACDSILLIDDGNSAVSLPETPLLAVLPGTGGLTRLVDKRKVRRDLADVFCTTAEGVKGEDRVEYSHLTLELDRPARRATLTLRGPRQDPPSDTAEAHAQGSGFWPLLAFRELDDALCHLRFNEETIGLVLLKTA